MRRSLNIALVSASDFTGDRSQVSHVRELARALGRPEDEGGAGHRVSVFGRRCSPDANARTRLASGATLFNLAVGPARPLSDDQLLGHVRELTDELRRRWSGAGRPDVVHGHGWIGGLAACAVARELGIPFAQTFHGLAATETRAGRSVHPSRARLERAIGRGADVVLARCTEEAAVAVRLGVPRRAVRITPPGVDVELFSEVGPAMPRGDRERLTVVSRDLEDGSAETAIRALQHVPDAELTVAGGPDREELENDASVHRLTVLAKELHVSDRVIFLGRVPRRSLPRLLRTTRIALGLAPAQPAPTATLEAMACGVPAVVTPSGTNADAVLDSITGLHVPAGRPRQIGLAVRGLLAEETTRRGYAIAAADRARSRHSWERIADETERVYLTIAPEPETLPDPDQDPDEAPETPEPTRIPAPTPEPGRKPEPETEPAPSGSIARALAETDSDLVASLT
ncbi:glycosyltransferase [Actinomadura rupiterrae]|uniref:glycosyltransferase n=1 Tax=Actinomadura rupiterrae TaxID=559627 RepID=UPI0020A49661|nr:glycosyltransferase [Actinomadura rupiterrae]MCP2339561.1 glycosyltransferase involved in cell wall biosynthesis [Actinomadura rupiterrae]